MNQPVGSGSRASRAARTCDRLVRDGQAAIDSMPEWRQGMAESLLVGSLEDARTELQDGTPADPDSDHSVVEVSSDSEPALDESASRIDVCESEEGCH